MLDRAQRDEDCGRQALIRDVRDMPPTMPVDMRNSRKPTGENALPAGGSSMYGLTYGRAGSTFGGPNTSVDELNYTKKTNIVFFSKIILQRKRRTNTKKHMTTRTKCQLQRDKRKAIDDDFFVH